MFFVREKKVIVGKWLAPNHCDFNSPENHADKLIQATKQKKMSTKSTIQHRNQAVSPVRTNFDKLLYMLCVSTSTATQIGANFTDCLRTSGRFYDPRNRSMLQSISNFEPCAAQIEIAHRQLKIGSKRKVLQCGSCSSIQCSYHHSLLHVKHSTYLAPHFPAHG